MVLLCAATQLLLPFLSIQFACRGEQQLLALALRRHRSSAAASAPGTDSPGALAESWVLRCNLWKSLGKHQRPPAAAAEDFCLLGVAERCFPCAWWAGKGPGHSLCLLPALAPAAPSALLT